MTHKIDWQTLGILAAMFAVALYFWDYTFIYPIKVFVVLLHEIGHGVVAVFTGGHIKEINLSSNLGGECWSAGGWRFLVLPAGYLGSLFFGGLIMVTAARTKWDKWISMMIGIIIFGFTVVYVRSWFGFGFGIVFSVLLFLAGLKLPEKVNDILLKFLGLTSCMYAVLDIKSDLIDRTVPGSDAYAMSQEFFLPAIF